MPTITFDTYQAGACNIGPAETARRRRDGLVGLAGAAALGIVLVAIDLPAWSRAAVFPLLAAAFVTLDQARRRFCVGFAVLGLRNFGAVGTQERVTDAAARSADRRMALRMVVQGAVLAAIVTAAFVLLPT